MRLRGAYHRLVWLRADWKLRQQIARVEAGLVRPGEGRPVLFFNASTRIHRPSLNAGFSLLASWAIRRSGVPVLYAVCQRGLDPCILGTDREKYESPPPCDRCLKLSRRLFPADHVVPIERDAAKADSAARELAGKRLEELAAWEHGGLRLGELCLPGLRWALRRHHLPDDEPTQALFRRYLASAASLAGQFEATFERLQPRALVLFNGLTYPEAVARAIALRRGVPTITHEVGLQPFSTFFSHRNATFREVELPPGFELNPEQNRRLDAYLEERFRGRFTMAGVRFWPEMQPLPQALVDRIRAHRRLAVVFTNVIFDTSQSHANTLYPDMFAWLGDVRQAIQSHPETFFVLRAHPDEDRPGKESRESVTDWVQATGVANLPNVAFFGPSEYVSSYELIHQAKVVLVYNSSVGLEASILGAPVLCAGRARYTQLPTVFFPASRAEYLRHLEDSLGDAVIRVPPDFARNARQFLYYELYEASLDLSEFLQPYPAAPGMVFFSAFDPARLDASPDLDVIREGILEGRPFVLP